MTTFNIIATSIVSIAVLFLVIIPIVRILFKWKYFKKLSLVTEREQKIQINPDLFSSKPFEDEFLKLDDLNDITTNPVYFNVQGNTFYDYYNNK